MNPTASFELDHVFIFISPTGSESSAFGDLGLVECSRWTHSGQGTSNVCYAFNNAYLEFIWVSNPNEIRSELVSPLGLSERSRWKETNASPFGLGLRMTTSKRSRWPFKMFPYCPPYLRPGTSIQIAESERGPSIPLVFVVPNSSRPDSPAALKKYPLDHPLGIRELTGVRIETPADELSADQLTALRDLGITLAFRAPGHRIELEFDHGAKGQRKNFHPTLPLAIFW
ncbi:MAG: VOC family protein [Elusimicrobia bacterium]|nr:VOC family protein [Elusimicrobiota bacterium]